jgi:hypothetical protein
MILLPTTTCKDCSPLAFAMAIIDMMPLPPVMHVPTIQHHVFKQTSKQKPCQPTPQQ